MGGGAAQAVAGGGRQARGAEGGEVLGDGNWALLYAVNATHLTVEGPGTIDGQGLRFNNYGQRDTPPPAGIGGAQRPYHLLLHRCEHVVVRDFRLVRCAFHSIRAIQSQHLRFDGLYIHNRVNGLPLRRRAREEHRGVQLRHLRNLRLGGRKNSGGVFEG